MNGNTKVNGISRCSNCHLNLSRSKQTWELFPNPSDTQHVTAACIHVAASPCRPQAQVCLVLPSSPPPQPKKPTTAPGPTQLLCGQGPGKTQKWESEPIPSHSTPSCWTYCLWWRPGTITAQHPQHPDLPPSHSSTTFSEERWTLQPSHHPLYQPWSSSSLAQYLFVHPEEPSKPSLMSKVHAFHTSPWLGFTTPYLSVHRASTAPGERRFKGKKGREGVRSTVCC